MNQLLTPIGLTLVHSLWESAIVWIALRLALTLHRDASGAIRYGYGCLALVAAMLAPVGTLAVYELSPDGPFAPGGQLPLPASPAGHPEASFAGHPVAAVGGLNLLCGLLVAGWLVGCGLKAVGLLRDLRSVRRLGGAELQPLGPEQHVLWLSTMNRLNFRRFVRVGYCNLVVLPSVVGWLKPAVLFPIGALTGLTSSQIESLFAHELAHVRRHDFLVNLVQSLCETVYFFNPAALAISNCIRLEREKACDEVAVDLVGDPRGLARALAQLEAARHPGIALAASGQGLLLPRIQRLLAASGRPPRGRATGLAAASLGLVYLGLFALIPLVAGTVRAAGMPGTAAALVAHGTGPELKAAIDEAARAWLRALDDANEDLAYSSAGIWLHAQSTEWGGLPPKTMEKWRKMGKCTSRVPTREVTFESNAKGPAQGNWAYAEYRSTYESGGMRIEEVAFMKEPDGNWRVSGFSLSDPK